MLLLLGTPLLLLMLNQLPSTHGYSRGAPMHACRHLAPMHNVDEPQLTPSPYSLAATVEQYANETHPWKIKVKLAGSTLYRGYLLQSQDPEGLCQGTFIDPPGTNVRCSVGWPLATITHGNSDPKEATEFFWESPPDFNDSIIFKAAVVQTMDIFWLDHTTSLDLPNTQPPTIPGDTAAATSNAKFSSLWIMVLLLFASYLTVTQ